jgi:hypothetical protein
VSDPRPPFALIAEAFGLPATVTRPAPDDTPIETTVVWVAPLPEEMPVGGTFRRQEPRRIASLPLAEVPTVPRGTVIEAAEAEGLETQTWRVDGIERVEFDHTRAIVLPAADEVS